MKFSTLPRCTHRAVFDLGRLQRGRFSLRRSLLVFVLLGCIAVSIAMMAVAVGRSPEFLSQHGARIVVLEPVGAFLVYAVAIVFIVRTHGPYSDTILKVATVFGLLTGALEVINIGIENGIPFAVRGQIVSVSFILVLFTSWGIAGFRTARSLRSTRAALLAAVLSAAICMVFAVTAGFVVQFFVAPPEPTYVSTWAEYQRSGWTDARAFGIANTLDSAFTHILVAPIVATIVGGIGALLARFRDRH